MHNILKVDNEKIEKICRLEWAAHSNLRAEFSRVEVYVAYTKAIASGRAKCYGGISK